MINLLVGAAVLGVPIFALGADDAQAKGQPAAVTHTRVNAESAAESAGSRDELRGSLLRGLRPENLTRDERERLHREVVLMFGPGRPIEDLSTLEIIRLMDRVLVDDDQMGRTEGGRRPQARVGPDRRGPRGGGGPLGGRRGGYRFGAGRPDRAESGRAGSLVQAHSPLFLALFEEESGQDPEISAAEYQELITRFDELRRNMAAVHFRMGHMMEKTRQEDKAAAEYRRILRHYSDVDDVKADAEKALMRMGKPLLKETAAE